MSRTIPTGTAESLFEPDLWPVGLVQLTFSSGTVWLWTGIGNLEWNGFTWTGAGTLGRIGPVEETAELRAVGVELELSGIPQEVLDIAKNEDWQNRQAVAYYGVLDQSRQWIGEPFQIFGGVMDQMSLREGAESKITLSCESDLIDLERTKARRYTPEDQASEYSGDKFFDAVAALQEIEIMWGRS